jgi:autotransporter-associated beta strand protein
VIVRYAGAPAAVGGTIDTASAPGYTLHTFSDVGSASLELSPAATMTSPITGVGGFTLDSVGTLTLSGNNSYQGGTIVLAGTLIAGSSAALGNGAVTVNPGGRLRLDPGSVIANEVTDLGSGFFAGSLEFAGGGLARTSTAGNATLGTLLAGSAGAAELLNPAIAWLPQTSATASDIMQLTGTAFVPQVLSLSYAPGLAPAAAQDVYLGWFDPASTSWVNAIDGNFGGASSFFQGSWGDYLAATPGATPASALGVYGHDPASSTVWAVVDHNSDFAVIVVPEPGTLALAGLGLTVAIATGLRHRRRGAGHSACQRV